MVAPACERETDIKGKKIRKKIQVTKQPHIKNTLSFHKDIFWEMNTNQKYLLNTILNFKFLLYSIVRLISSTIKSQKKPAQANPNIISIQTFIVQLIVLYFQDWL